ncbi:hypothetical protein FHT02_000624 [Sphingomonas xinjiangensis]|uniref:Uncharacterized protein n=1 Tax=Sphingomonas xinjiangensis TaxID=643568 RepID=A0A840YF72_9SPHN|nr:hypothetical protein [Sphingomonas xinjiangensis]
MAKTRATRATRGATLNAESARFNLAQREADGDWLDAQADIDGAPPPLRTTVTVEKPRTILTRNSSPDVRFDQSVNPYRGCDQPRNGCVTVPAIARLAQPSCEGAHGSYFIRSLVNEGSKQRRY